MILKNAISQLWRQRIIRYGFVGGIGIPVNLLAYAIFRHLMSLQLDWLASALSFEISTTVNFVLNQVITYSEQKHLRGWDWPKRALRAQVTSATGLILAYVVALTLKLDFHWQPYVAQASGIVAAFAWNFMISNRFVFTPHSAVAGRRTVD